MRTILLAFVVAGLTSSSLADWPTFQSNNARVATSDQAIKTPLQLRWVYTAPTKPQSAWEGPRNSPIEGHTMRHRVKFDDAIQVVIADGKAYYGSNVDHHVYCVAAASGKPIWRFCTEGPVRLAPTLAGGKVYFGSDDGLVYCLDAKSGEVVWKLRPTPRDERLLARGEMISRWPIRTGVLVDDGVAYFGAGIFPHETIYLCAADAKTGKLIWKNDSISHQDAGRNDLSPQGYLLCNEELLYVPSGRSLPVAFSKKTGEMVHGRKHAWRSTAGGVVGGTAALLGDGQIYSSGPHHFLAMNQKDGNIGAAWIHGRQMTFAGEHAYIATGELVIKVNRKEHSQASIKRQELFLKLRRSPANERAQIEKQRAELAKVGIEWAAKNNADGSLAACSNLVFAGGNGKVTAYAADTGEAVWNADVEGDVRGIAISDGVVIATTTEGKIYGFTDAVRTPASVKVENYPATSKVELYGELEGIAAEVRDILEAIHDDPYGGELGNVYAAAAKDIVNTTNIQRGFCLVVGGEQGQLAFELAKQSELKIYCVEPDARKVAIAREKLTQAALYGHRITVVHCPLDEIPFSNYFANLVVSDSLISTGEIPVDVSTIARHVKPLGGKICFGLPSDAPVRLASEKETKKRLIAFAIDAVTTKLGRANMGDNYTTVTRSALPGAGSWSHQYGDAGNTSNSRDYRVKGEMGVLWYGDPGPSQMINRHEGAMSPLSVGGRMFVQGEESIMAYDIYNGLFLWEQKNPGALRTGVFNNEDTTNLVATEDALFCCVKDTCTEYDAATGKIRRVHRIPAADDDRNRAWGYVAVADGKLFGTSTVRSELRRELRRRGRKVENATDAIFAIDLKTGELAWQYQGKNIMHMTIAIADGRAHFIDSSITPEEREAFLKEDKSALEKLTGKEREEAEKELKRRDLRLAVAIDAETGDQLWSKPVDVTDCSHLGIGGGQMTLMASEGNVVICGANANGHFWRQFLAGEFSKRRLLVLDAKTGEKQWAKDANYRHRPIVVGEKIIAEPWAFDIADGSEIKRSHPLTGEQTDWMFSRPGHHCGAISASPNTLFFRSGFIGYYDLYDDSGTRHFAGQRLGCWINALPSGGVVAIPEASAGCVCLFSIASTVVLEPREDRHSWGIYSAAGAKTPVKNLAINFGGPGDRRDEQGNLWLAFPRPKTVGRLEYVFDVAPKLYSGGDYYSRNDESIEIAGTDSPWVYTSGVRGLQSCEIPLLGKEDQPARYNVTLHLAALADDEAEASTFDVLLNGEALAKQINLVKEAGGVGKALTLEFADVGVTQSLKVELRSADANDSAKLPTLSGIEVHRQD